MKKNFSNILKIVVLCLVITAFLTTAFACSKDHGDGIYADKITKDECVNVISDSEVILFVSDKLNNLEDKTLEDLMNYYVSEGYLTYEATDGSWGKFITSVNGKVANDANSEFWAIYTSDANQASTEYDSYKYEDKTLGSSNYGVSSLKIAAGDIIVLKLASY